MPRSDTQVLAAEWVLPVTSDAIRDGVVVVEETRIAWVGGRRELPSRYLEAPVRAFPRSLLLPGWVNAHSHLNLTAALGLLRGSADRFTDWIRDLLRLQQSWPTRIVEQSVVAGLDLLASTGTTTVAHVSTLPELEPFLAHPMRSVVFHEPIGFRAEQADPLARQAEEWLDAAGALIDDSGSTRVTLGIAPHAPYSVSPELYQRLAALAALRALPLSTHVSETVDEIEFLRTGAGPFRALLEERGAWDPSWKPPGVSPVRYLADLGILERPGLAVHCNYLSDEDAALLGQSRLVPTWCPGSHRFFGHRAYPALRLMEAGASPALGTDSAASNAGLNMLREVRLAAEACSEVDRSGWLEAATRTGARALGLGERTGSLETGKAADLQVLEAQAEMQSDPLAALFEDNLRVRSVLVDGSEVRIR